MAKTKSEEEITDSKKTKRTSPFEPMHDIREALKDCSTLIKQGIITLELIYPYNVRFRVDEEKFDSLSTWDGEKRKKFRGILSHEITLGLQSALSGELLPHFAPFIFDSKTVRDAAQAIMEETKKILVNPPLETWARIKHSSKNNVIQSLEWEINTKERDRYLGELTGVKYATVRVWYNKPDNLNVKPGMFTWPLFLEKENYSITVDLPSQEIRGLINDLSKILKALDE